MNDSFHPTPFASSVVPSSPPPRATSNNNPNLSRAAPSNARPTSAQPRRTTSAPQPSSSRLASTSTARRISSQQTTAQVRPPSTTANESRSLQSFVMPGRQLRTVAPHELEKLENGTGTGTGKKRRRRGAAEEVGTSRKRGKVECPGKDVVGHLKKEIPEAGLDGVSSRSRNDQTRKLEGDGVAAQGAVHDDFKEEDVYDVPTLDEIAELMAAAAGTVSVRQPGTHDMGGDEQSVDTRARHKENQPMGQDCQAVIASLQDKVSQLEEKVRAATGLQEKVNRLVNEVLVLRKTAEEAETRSRAAAETTARRLNEAKAKADKKARKKMNAARLKMEKTIENVRKDAERVAQEAVAKERVERHILEAEMEREVERRLKERLEEASRVLMGVVPERERPMPPPEVGIMD
ncbi:hypothetical protein BJ508DRAFT_409975 [Ascobolus immersus RN42]|uniref:Uncharacterized protein n=1 Tax=Ascobolus immersus RN42 TaxID=1160509 RepID=A0A3N4IV25_ASCIM|nr:hypothetical protein BJ508DRAFT_409975 [Ascobolus immersus RN42]